MRKIVLYIATSIDHYIARPDGDISWLHAPEYAISGEDYGYKEFYESIETTLMGNITYKQFLGFDLPFPFPDKKNFISTRFVGNRGVVHIIKFVAILI